MITKKFWCHYIGSDGNTPKRRSIELTDIHELLPNVSNEGAKTPVWFETEHDDSNEAVYYMYAQLSDNVAVFIPRSGFNERQVKKFVRSDDEIDAEYRRRLEDVFAEYPKMSEEKKAMWTENYQTDANNDKAQRDRLLSAIAAWQDYGNYLLGGAFVTASALRAFEEARSPILSGLKELRAMALEEREREEQERREEERKRKEEEARKQAEERATDDAKIQRLVELGVLPDKPLSNMQRGTVLIALQQRYNVLLKNGSRFIGTLYDIIDKHGFTEVHRQAKVWNKYGERIAKPKREYSIFPPDSSTGTSIDGHFGALCVIDQKHDTEY